jgi:hypothetical protein
MKAALAAILTATLAVYLTAGLPSAYIAADDFQWLAGGHTFSWSRLLYVTGGDRFYRPMADLWFASTTSVCGFTLSCHHLLLLALHAVNASLVFVLASWLFRSLRTAWLAGLLFALNPAYTQAVVWLSGVTGVLCAFGYLGALTALVWSWRAQSGRDQRMRELLAVALFAGAVFSHEAAVTLPIVAAVMWRLFGPAEGAPRRIPLAGAALVLAVFAAATIVANRRNVLFSGSGYTVGSHMLDHALDYVASLYVGPSSASAHVAIVIALAGLLMIDRATRFGVLWLFVTMIPYLPFTAGNTSRYAYLPAIGFSWAVAAAIVAGLDRLRLSRRGLAGTAGILYAATVLFVVIRFAPFATASIRGHVRAFEEWRSWAREIADSTEKREPAFRVPPLRDGRVEPMYVEPMVRWELQDYTTPIEVEGR